MSPGSATASSLSSDSSVSDASATGPDGAFVILKAPPHVSVVAGSMLSAVPSTMRLRIPTNAIALAAVGVIGPLP